MYQFSIKKQESGGYRFELDGINIITEEYIMQDGMHKLANPSKTIAYFSIDDNIYGISNDSLKLSTVEDLYESINKQYRIFKTPLKTA